MSDDRIVLMSMRCEDHQPADPRDSEIAECDDCGKQVWVSGSATPLDDLDSEDLNIPEDIDVIVCQKCGPERVAYRGVAG